MFYALSYDLLILLMAVLHLVGVQICSPICWLMNSNIASCMGCDERLFSKLYHTDVC